MILKTGWQEGKYWLNTQGYLKKKHSSELALQLKNTILIDYIWKDITMFGRIKDSELGVRWGYLRMAIADLHFWLPHTYISTVMHSFHNKLSNFIPNERTANLLVLVNT